MPWNLRLPSSVQINPDHGHVEHHLNGVKVLEFERGSEDYRILAGHILLQDHGNEVSFKHKNKGALGRF